MSTMSHVEQSSSPHRCETEVWYRWNGFPPHWVFSGTEWNTALDGKVFEVLGIPSWLHHRESTALQQESSAEGFI